MFGSNVCVGRAKLKLPTVFDKCKNDTIELKNDKDMATGKIHLFFRLVSRRHGFFLVFCRVLFLKMFKTFFLSQLCLNWLKFLISIVLLVPTPKSMENFTSWAFHGAMMHQKMCFYLLSSYK